MDLLDQHIRSLGLTRSAFARRLGISAPYLTQILTGAKRPGLELAVAIERETGGAVPATAWIPQAKEGAA